MHRQQDHTVVRSRLGLGNGPVALNCGRLTVDKRLTELVAAADLLRARFATFELVVIGDGPGLKMLEAARASRPWIHVVGARYGRDRAEYFVAADLLLHPAPLGLIAVDAMHSALPVFSMAGMHGPEASFLAAAEPPRFINAASSNELASVVGSL